MYGYYLNLLKPEFDIKILITTQNSKQIYYENIISFYYTLFSCTSSIVAGPTKQ